LRIIGKTTDINTPEDASLKIGDKFKSLDEYQADANKSARNVVELENTVERQNKRVSELSKASQQAQEEIQVLQDLINRYDPDEVEESLDLIVQQMIEISETINGIGIEISE